MTKVIRYAWSTIFTADTTDRTLVHIHVLHLQVNSGKAGMADTDDPPQKKDEHRL